MIVKTYILSAGESVTNVSTRSIVGFACALAMAGGIIVAEARLSDEDAISDAYPILLVHGICSGSSIWEPIIISLQASSTARFGFPDSETKLFSYDGSVYERKEFPNMNTTAFDSIGIDQTRRLFMIDFNSGIPDPDLMFDIDEVNDVQILDKAVELANVIETVKKISDKPKVILVTHSLGGLVARTYTTGFAGMEYESGEPDSPMVGTAVAYNDDVAGLVTIDTPHGGAFLADIIGLQWGCQAEGSQNKKEMRTDSTLIGRLAGRTMAPDIAVTAIKSWDGFYDLHGFRGLSDGVVLVDEQSLSPRHPYTLDTFPYDNVSDDEVLVDRGALFQNPFSPLHSTILRTAQLHNRVRSLIEAFDRNAQPEGGVDSASCDSVLGWAWNPYDESAAIEVDLFVSSDSVNFRFLARRPANEYRADLPGTGFHGFSFAGLTGVKSGDRIWARVVGTTRLLDGRYGREVFCLTPSLLMAHLDAPQESEVVGEAITGRGWAFSCGRNISRHRLLVDAFVRPGIAFRTVSRPDVQAAHVGICPTLGSQVGFEFSFDPLALGLSPGTHTVALRATDELGRDVTTSTHIVTVSGAPATLALGWLDEPHASQAISGSVPGWGWAFSCGRRITSRALVVDGAARQGVAFTASSRPDVQAAHVGACPTLGTDIGFDFTFDPIALRLSPGTHTVAVRATDSGNAQVTSASRTVTVTALNEAPVISHISPTSHTVGTFTVTVNGSGFDPAAAQLVLTGPGCATDMACVVPNGVLTNKSVTQLVGPITISNAGSFTIRVQHGAGGPFSNGLPLTATAAAAPRITSPTPSEYFHATQPVFTFSGTGFQSGLVVRIQTSGSGPADFTVGAPNVSDVTSTSFKFQLSFGGYTGATVFSVINPDGQASNFWIIHVR